MGCVGCLGINQGSHKESRKKNESGKNSEPRKNNELRKASLSFDMSLQSKEIFVRIVHAGGREELYQYAIPASHLLEKYPGMCVARPEVFKSPKKSLLWPDENLLPGQKYLIIPYSTARKLRQKEKKAAKFTRNYRGEDEISGVNITWDESTDISVESISSAKDFYTSKHSLSNPQPPPVRRNVRSKKPFVPPLPKTRIIHRPGWEPGLTSIREVSP